MKAVVLIVVVFATLSRTEGAKCGECEPNQIACTGIDTFKKCSGTGTEASGPTFQCKGRLVCSSGEADWCIDPRDQPNKVDCVESCDGVCPSQNGNPVGFEFTHECLGPHTYRLCSGYGPIDQTCPDGQVCTVLNKCSSPKGEIATCHWKNDPFVTSTSPSESSTIAGPTTSTTAEPQTLSDYCIGKPVARYPLPTPDPKCKQYVICSDGNAKIYQCGANQTFNSAVGNCQSGLAPGCAA
ncbi:hypothetical protein ACFFRR_007075 [Megaselia abdita]